MASPAPVAPSPSDDRPGGSNLVPLQKLQEIMQVARLQYQLFEDTLVHKVKGVLLKATENPFPVLGVGAAAGLLLLRGPRRFLFRHTLGRLQSEEARFFKAEKGLKELNESVSRLNADTNKLLKLANVGEDEMLRGETKIKNTGKEIQRLLKSIYKIESEATDIVDGLRTLPGRNALHLRAEVASMASELKGRRSELDKKITSIAELGFKV